jgi:hypothetical protein
MNRRTIMITFIHTTHLMLRSHGGSHMSDKFTYTCSICGKSTDLESSSAIPECCGKPMEKLPACTKTFTAEWARGTETDEPCKEG